MDRVSKQYYERMTIIMEELDTSLGDFDALQADIKSEIETMQETYAEVCERAEKIAQSLDLNRKAVPMKTCDETKGNYEDNPLLALYDEVIQQSNIKSEIACVIGLAQIGKTQIWRGICPFHQDRHPSLEVNEASQKFKCLSCGESGDIVDFAMKYRQTAEREALIYLAENFCINSDDFLKE